MQIALRSRAAIFRNSKTAHRLLPNWKLVSVASQQRPDEVVGRPLDKTGLPEEAEIIPLRLVPLVSWAQAGQAVDYEELPVSWQKRVHTSVTDPKAFAVRIAGDSMEPRYHEGDVAFLEPSRPARQHDTVIARLKDEGVVFKIYSRTGDAIRFSSYNPAYLPFEVTADEVAWVFPVHSVLSIVSK